MTETKRVRRTQGERREVAETRIIVAAIGLLVERGFDAFTLSDVGVASGYSRGLPAHYFGRKEDLLSAAVQYIVDRYFRSIADIATEQPGLPRLEAMIREYARLSQSDDGRAMTIIVAEAIVRPALRSTVEGVNERGLALFGNEIRAGVEAGNIRASVNARDVSKMIYAFLRGQMSFAAFGDSYRSPAAIEEFIGALRTHLVPGH